MTAAVQIRPLRSEDRDLFVQCFANDDVELTLDQFERFDTAQLNGHKRVLVAEVDERLAGYVTIIWESGYAPFFQSGTPEISDLLVLEAYQRRGYGSALLDAAESRIKARSSQVGIGVGLTPDYGAAQILYVKRGYLPDGRGMAYAGAPVEHGEMVRADDALVLYLCKQLKSSP